MANAPRSRKSDDDVADQTAETAKQATDETAATAKQNVDTAAKATKQATDDKNVQAAAEETAKTAKHNTEVATDATKRMAEQMEQGQIPRFDLIAQDMMRANIDQMRRVFGSDAFERMTEQSKATNEAFRESSKIMLEGVIDVNREVSSFVQGRMKNALDSFKAMQKADDLPARVRLQNEYLQTALSEYTEEAKKIADLATERQRASIDKLSASMQNLIERMNELGQQVEEKARNEKAA